VQPLPFWGWVVLLVLNCLPSIGGAANKESVLDAELGKSGVSLTAPLVNVDVPFPTAEVKDGKKK